MQQWTHLATGDSLGQQMDGCTTVQGEELPKKGGVMVSVGVVKVTGGNLRDHDAEAAHLKSCLEMGRARNNGPWEDHSEGEYTGVCENMWCLFVRYINLFLQIFITNNLTMPD